MGYDEDVDANDGTDWTAEDLWDLKNSLAHGSTIEDVTELLCRQGEPEEVRRKADELGLQYTSRPKVRLSVH